MMLMHLELFRMKKHFANFRADLRKMFANRPTGRPGAGKAFMKSLGERLREAKQQAMKLRLVHFLVLYQFKIDSYCLL